MEELRSAMKGQAMENLDGMIRRTNSPFTIEMLNRPLQPKFHLPHLESYNDSNDPLYHIESFKTLMHLHMTPDEVMCRAFPTTPKAATRVWFSKIPPRYQWQLHLYVSLITRPPLLAKFFLYLAIYIYIYIISLN